MSALIYARRLRSCEEMPTLLKRCDFCNAGIQPPGGIYASDKLSMKDAPMPVGCIS